jgi:hypothetical protein
MRTVRIGISVTALPDKGNQTSCSAKLLAYLCSWVSDYVNIICVNCDLRNVE